MLNASPATVEAEPFTLPAVGAAVDSGGVTSCLTLLSTLLSSDGSETVWPGACTTRAGAV